MDTYTHPYMHAHAQINRQTDRQTDRLQDYVMYSGFVNLIYGLLGVNLFSAYHSSPSDNKKKPILAPHTRASGRGSACFRCLIPQPPRAAV